MVADVVKEDIAVLEVSKRAMQRALPVEGSGTPWRLSEDCSASESQTHMPWLGLP